MGSIVELNDTLQITKEQGFPQDLDLEKHLKNPLKAEDFAGIEFEFHSKPKIRNYQASPIRNFLVENRGGKWIYWGLVHITEVQLDYKNNTTSGKFKIEYLYNPNEMKKAHELIDRNPDTNYFN